MRSIAPHDHQDRRQGQPRKGRFPAFPKETYQRWFKDMVLMRRFEEKCGHLYTMQKFGGFCHLYIGQEAVLAGMVTAIRKTDRIITGYRDHCHPLALGDSPKRVMAELYGKTTGTSKGKGGSMHFFDKSRNLFGARHRGRAGRTRRRHRFRRLVPRR